MTEQHAKYSPSKLPRIVECPASGLFEHPTDNAVSSSYADDGTNLHSATREHLDGNQFVAHPDITKKYSLDQPRIDAVQECLDYVWALRQSYFSRRIPFYDLVETRVSLDEWIPNTQCDALNEVSGTLDYALIAEPANGPRILHIADWKFGQGVEVFPDSEQLKAYALGVLLNENYAQSFDEVHLTIIQPRLAGEDLIKVHTTSVNSLVNWLGKILTPALNGINAKHPIFKPSIKACRWCPNKMACPARHALIQQLAVDTFSVHSTLPTPDLTALISLHEQASLIKDYLSDIAEYMYDLLRKGASVPGYKLVQGKSNRAWADEKKAMLWCTEHDVDPDKMFVSKFFTPAAAEKVIGAKLKKDPSFLSLVIKPEGSPSLVKKTDKREALIFRSATEIFTNANLID